MPRLSKIPTRIYTAIRRFELAAQDLSWIGSFTGERVKRVKDKYKREKKAMFDTIREELEK